MGKVMDEVSRDEFFYEAAEISVNGYTIQTYELDSLLTGGYIYDSTIEAYLSCVTTRENCYIMDSICGSQILYDANFDSVPVRSITLLSIFYLIFLHFLLYLCLMFCSLK
jgi:hypothetical protein